MTQQLKNGQYSYLEADQLGKGSFGKVFKGKITANNQVVAIKVIDMNDLRKFGEQIYQVITTQISVMIKLSKEICKTNFPYIVKIYDCFRTQNNIYMILEYCGQGDLEGLLRAKKSLPESEATNIIYQISESLQFLAKHQIAHRDLKPQNIFIKKQKFKGKERILYKLGDFGFAAEKKTFSTTLGTYPYMAPELFQENGYSTAVDIWALGIISHQILFDEIYFIGKDQFEIKKKVLKNNYQLKLSQKQKISESMHDFLRKCLKKDPKQRLNGNIVAQHEVFKNISKEMDIITETNRGENINYVIKNLKRQIFKCALMKAVAVDLRDLVESSDFGVIYLLKKAKFLLNHILQSLKNQKCPFMMQSSLWFDFVRSNNLKDGINFMMREIEQLDHIFADYLSRFKIYMKKFSPSDQQKIQSILTASPTSDCFNSIFTKQLQRWVSVLSKQKNEKKKILGAECYVMLEADNLINYQFQKHYATRKQIDIAQIQKWFKSQ